MNFKFLPKEKIANLPQTPGIYGFWDKKVLYLGKASNLRERIKNHFQNPSFRDNLFISKVKKIGYLKLDSEIEALILEANLIKKYQPKYNIVWRDDKNYFFVGKTNEDFPRIFITHQAKLKKIKNQKLKIDYFGPFVEGKALKQTLKLLRKVFPYRSCQSLPKRPCLWYHLGKCLAPCQLKIKNQKEEFNQIKKESQKNAKNLLKILQGKKKEVLKNLKKEMEKLSQKEDFERAAKIRDQIFALKKIFLHSKIIEPSQAFNWPEIEKSLRELFKIKRKISRIEAYDVSNIFGKEATGSMVAFFEGKAEKNFYRKFKIKITQKPNDVLMLREILERRFSHPEWPLPDLILIDGGKAQLNVALSEIKKKKLKILAMALAKRKNELFVEGKKEAILLNFLPTPLKLLILKIRDEAHRFAIQYHKKLRRKTLKA